MTNICRKRCSVLGIFAVTCASMCADIAEATIVTVPTDLNPGDPYRLVFVTSGLRDATSTSIADYNSFVDGFGDTALPGDWRVIGSTPTTNVIANTNTPTSTPGIPIYRLDGARVADDYAELWGSSGIQASISIYENGGVDGGGWAVGTGSSSLGTTNVDFELGAITKVRRGRSVATGSDWVEAFLGSPDGDYRFYGMSELLTVPGSPVPEPSTYAMAAVGLFALALYGWRRRRV